jgi:hypothetical protein
VPPPTLAARLQAAFGAQFHDLRATLPHGAPPYAKRSLSAIHQTLLHHTATALTTTWESIANYHVNSLGWPGVGYHIGVHVDGRVSLLNDLETISYHAGVANGNSVSICVVGNYEKDAVSAALWRRIQEVKAVVDEHLGRVLPFIGHRDAPGNATVCPGKNLEARLKVPEVPMSDPRASNCRAFHINADGKVDGIALVYQPVPSARYACVKAELIDEAQAQGNTVVTVSIMDENGILTAERALMVWPYGEPLAEDAPAGPGNTDNRFSIAGGKYTPPAIGPLGFIVGDAADKAISDYIWGYGLPGNRHVSGRVTFKERSAVPPVEPPITPPDSLTDALVEQIRNLAANSLTVGMSAGVPYNPTLAFPKKARELKLGAQTTLELRQIKGWVVQGFAFGILVCPDGKWSEMTLVTY